MRAGLAVAALGLCSVGAALRSPAADALRQLPPDVISFAKGLKTATGTQKDILKTTGPLAFSSDTVAARLPTAKQSAAWGTDKVKGLSVGSVMNNEFSMSRFLTAGSDGRSEGHALAGVGMTGHDKKHNRDEANFAIAATRVSPKSSDIVLAIPTKDSRSHALDGGFNWGSLHAEAVTGHSSPREVERYFDGLMARGRRATDGKKEQAGAVQTQTEEQKAEAAQREQKTSEALKEKALEEQRQAQKEREGEEQGRAAAAKWVEEQRRAEAAKSVGEQRRAEAAKWVEEQRRAQEEARKLEEQRRAQQVQKELEEQRRDAEELRELEEQRREQRARKELEELEEQRRAQEEARKLEEQTGAQQVQKELEEQRRDAEELRELEKQRREQRAREELEEQRRAQQAGELEEQRRAEKEKAELAPAEENAQQDDNLWYQVQLMMLKFPQQSAVLFATFRSWCADKTHALQPAEEAERLKLLEGRWKIVTDVQSPETAGKIMTIKGSRIPKPLGEDQGDAVFRAYSENRFAGIFSMRSPANDAAIDVYRPFKITGNKMEWDDGNVWERAEEQALAQNPMPARLSIADIFSNLGKMVEQIKSNDARRSRGV